MRVILKRIFIGVAIGMALFFLKSEVFALSLDEQFISNVQILNSASTYTFPVLNAAVNDGHSVQTLTFKSNITPPSSAQFLIIPFTSDLINMPTNESTSNNLNQFSFSWVQSFVSSAQLMNSGSGGSSFCNIENTYIVCPVVSTGVYTSLRYRYHTVNAGSSSFADSFLSLTFSDYASWVKRASSDSSSAIQQQTDDILDSDSPSSKDYNNDYSTNSFDSASNSVNQHTDTDVSTLNLNTQNYNSSWSWLWSLVNSFISNTKVFACYIFMLTLGFISLVLGR